MELPPAPLGLAGKAAGRAGGRGRVIEAQLEVLVRALLGDLPSSLQQFTLWPGGRNVLHCDGPAVLLVRNGLFFLSPQPANLLHLLLLVHARVELVGGHVQLDEFVVC